MKRSHPSRSETPRNAEQSIDDADSSPAGAANVAWAFLGTGSYGIVVKATFDASLACAVKWIPIWNKDDPIVKSSRDDRRQLFKTVMSEYVCQRLVSALPAPSFPRFYGAVYVNGIREKHQSPSFMEMQINADICINPRLRHIVLAMEDAEGGTLTAFLRNTATRRTLSSAAVGPERRWPLEFWFKIAWSLAAAQQLYGMELRDMKTNNILLRKVSLEKQVETFAIMTVSRDANARATPVDTYCVSGATGLSPVLIDYGFAVFRSQCNDEDRALREATAPTPADAREPRDWAVQPDLDDDVASVAAPELFFGRSDLRSLASETWAFGVIAATLVMHPLLVKFATFPFLSYDIHHEFSLTKAGVHLGNEFCVRILGKAYAGRFSPETIVALTDAVNLKGYMYEHFLAVAGLMDALGLGWRPSDAEFEGIYLAQPAGNVLLNEHSAKFALMVSEKNSIFERFMNDEVLPKTRAFYNPLVAGLSEETVSSLQQMLAWDPRSRPVGIELVTRMHVFDALRVPADAVVSPTYILSNVHISADARQPRPEPLVQHYLDMEYMVAEASSSARSSQETPIVGGMTVVTSATNKPTLAMVEAALYQRACDTQSLWKQGHV